ncbi:MAG TPA: hypothetical protein VIM71_11005 [Lacunisphaera sp.]
MHSVKKSAIALAMLAIAGASQAQQAATSSSPTGRLGQRYVGTSYGFANYQDAREEFHDVSIGVNLPVGKSVDLDFGYGYQWLTNNPVSLDGHSLDAGATLYTSTHGVKPFASASLAHLWSKASYHGVTARDDESFYAVSVGVEVPVAKIILTPSVGVQDSLNDGGDPTYAGGIDAHYWVTSKVGLRAAISYSDYGSGLKSWNYRLGARVKF